MDGFEDLARLAGDFLAMAQMASLVVSDRLRVSLKQQCDLTR